MTERSKIHGVRLSVVSIGFNIANDGQLPVCPDNARKSRALAESDTNDDYAVQSVLPECSDKTKALENGFIF